MRECNECTPSIERSLQIFASKYKIEGGNSVLAWKLRSELEQYFPGLYNLILSPERWVGQFGPTWFPVDPQKMAGQRLHIEVVTAPLPFVAVVKRINCTNPECGLTHRIVHIGANFYVLAAHISAFFVNRGLSTANLAQLIGDLATAQPNWGEHSAPAEVPRHILAAAMGLLLCHELGHFASPHAFSVWPRPEVFVPENVRSRLEMELSADHNAFRILMHRQQAAAPLDSIRFCNLLAGAALLLRTWNILIPKGWERRPCIHSYASRVGAVTPSPTARWRNIESIFESYSRIGFALWEDYHNLEVILFGDCEKKVESLWREMDERGIILSA